MSKRNRFRLSLVVSWVPLNWRRRRVLLNTGTVRIRSTQPPQAGQCQTAMVIELRIIMDSLHLSEIPLFPSLISLSFPSDGFLLLAPGLIIKPPPGHETTK